MSSVQKKKTLNRGRKKNHHIKKVHQTCHDESHGLVGPWISKVAQTMRAKLESIVREESADNVKESGDLSSRRKRKVTYVAYGMRRVFFRFQNYISMKQGRIHDLRCALVLHYTFSSNFHEKRYGLMDRPTD